MFDKGTKAKNEGNIVSSTNGPQTSGFPYANKNKNLDTDLNAHHKN